MKKLLSLLLILFLLAMNLSSCSLITNFIYVEPLCLAEIDGEMYFLSICTDENYKLDFENKTISMIQYDTLPAFEEEMETKNAFKFEQFHGAYNEIENEKLAMHLESCELTDTDSLIYALGYWQDEILTGFAQVYDGYAPTCSGYDISNIDHSLLFTYNLTTDTFTATKEIEDVAIVAFSGESVIYWKNRAYYAYDLQTGAERFLTEDKAFDSDITNYSTPYVYFNGEMCIFHLIKDKARDKVFFYAFNFETNEFFELKRQ